VIEGRSIQVPDLVADPEFADPEFNRPRQHAVVTMRAGQGVPLMRDRVPVRVLTIEHREPQPYSEKEIELVTTCADQAVIAIENVRLFEALQAR
jgi:two-component system, NtrC family, sensor kinase